jgi:hypothetical protein
LAVLFLRIVFYPKKIIPNQSIHQLLFPQPGRLNISEKIEAQMISRRTALWILGIGVAFGIGMQAAVLPPPISC